MREHVPPFPFRTRGDALNARGRSESVPGSALPAVWQVRGVVFEARDLHARLEGGLEPLEAGDVVVLDARVGRVADRARGGRADEPLVLEVAVRADLGLRQGDEH